MKSALIIGATSTIGKAIIEAFIRDGYDLTLAGRNSAKLDALTASIMDPAVKPRDDKKWNGTTPHQFESAISQPESATSQPKSVIPRLDRGIHPEIFCQTFSAIDDEKSLKNVFNNHHAKYGAPNVVINLAAIQAPIGKTWESSNDDWQKNIHTNLFGSFLVTKYAIKQAIADNSPCSIILFSGGGAAYARPNFSAYGCSKTAVVRLAETVFRELEEEGLNKQIQINSIAPGAVNSPMMTEIIESGLGCAGSNEIKNAKEVTQGAGSPPEKAAKLCLFLADRSKNNGLSGRLIHVNEAYEDYANNSDYIMNDKGMLRRL